MGDELVVDILRIIYFFVLMGLIVFVLAQGKVVPYDDSDTLAKMYSLRFFHEFEHQNVLQTQRITEPALKNTVGDVILRLRIIEGERIETYYINEQRFTNFFPMTATSSAYTASTVQRTYYLENGQKQEVVLTYVFAS
ncbi:MAG: hypothetical protein ACMXYF_03700 [Candidatus Woesearchaeota archaeon]